MVYFFAVLKQQLPGEPIRAGEGGVVRFPIFTTFYT